MFAKASPNWTLYATVPAPEREASSKTFLIASQTDAVKSAALTAPAPDVEATTADVDWSGVVDDEPCGAVELGDALSLLHPVIATTNVNEMAREANLFTPPGYLTETGPA